MYAVVTTGGKQYRVEPGSELVVERLAADPGATITFDRVLLVGDGEAVTVGTPTVDGATVSATVLGEALGPKLIIFKFKQKVKYRRHTGHRQHLTRVRIDEITSGGRKATRSEAATEQPAAEAEAPAEKPKRTRKATPKAEAASADAGETAEATEKPKRTRKAATKAESEE
ncbi:MAG TPA: 50S ribosomal protein L21 [Candidatus Limnocylindria bacterium]|nr:50S ribosomal protein L21 [Candidatus Limnocylindria bacterium]